MNKNIDYRPINERLSGKFPKNNIKDLKDARRLIDFPPINEMMKFVREVYERGETHGRK